MSEEPNSGPQLPWGISSAQLMPGSLKTISDSKLATFAIGQQKKTRFQKAREEKEMKKKQEEEAAALVYEQFVASFDVNESGKTFVRGVAEGPAIGKAVAAKGEIYTMDSKKQSSELDKRTGVREMDRMLEEMKVFLSNNYGRCIFLRII